jgi:PEP-CTERM motif
MGYSKSVVVAAILLGAVCLNAPAAEASAVPLSHVTGDVFFNFQPPNRIFLTDLGSASLDDARYGSVAVSALGMPFPSIVASADIGTGQVGVIFGRADAALTYFFEVVGPTGSVPVLIDVAGAVTGTATTGASFVLTSRWDLFDLANRSLAGDNISTPQLSGTFTQSFGRTVSLSLATNQFYSITLFADAEAAATDLGSRSIANALIDPVLSFGAGVDPSLYSFELSDGIGNGAAVPSSVPEPATLTLISTGLVSLWTTRRRRKESGQTPN